MELEYGLRVVDEGDEGDLEPDDAGTGGTDTSLGALRDAFLEAFNARDLDAVLDCVRPDVECPELGGSGAPALVGELAAIWDRSPAALLTRAELDGAPCAVAWLPDEDAGWSRAALVCFDADEAGLLGLVELAEDADALDRAEADHPDADDGEEGLGWAEWADGEEPSVRAHR